jgi:dihydroorotate dehydrogenase
MTIGVAGVHSGRDGYEPIAAVGALVVVGSMLMFAMLVFRPAAADRAASRAFLAAAE